jgi:hypothetical protein
MFHLDIEPTKISIFSLKFEKVAKWVSDVNYSFSTHISTAQLLHRKLTGKAMVTTCMMTFPISPAKTGLASCERLPERWTQESGTPALDTNPEPSLSSSFLPLSRKLPWIVGAIFLNRHIDTTPENITITLEGNTSCHRQGTGCGRVKPTQIEFFLFPSLTFYEEDTLFFSKIILRAHIEKNITTPPPPPRRKYPVYY